MRPDFCQVEDVPAITLSICGVKDLNVYCPRWVLSLFDGLEQVLSLPVGIGRVHCRSFLIRKVLDSLIGLYVYLHVFETSVLLGELVGVARIGVHMSIRVGRTTIAESVHDLMNRFLVRGEVVPEIRCVLEIGPGISLLCVNEDRKQGGIANKEDRRIVEHPIPVPFIGVKLD